MPDQSPAPYLDIKAPNISINQADRAGMVNVMFKLDPNVLDWIFNTFGDSHLVNEGTQELPDLKAIPNSSLYRCPTCHINKSVDMGVMKNYLKCSGKDEASRHAEVYTVPIDHKPILKSPGIYLLLGQVRGTHNANIATANSSASEADTKQKITLEDRMKKVAFGVAFTTLAVLVGNYKTYCSDWIIQEKKLHSVFSVGFCENFLIQFTMNIQANYNKGKNMAAAGRAMDTKTEVTQRTYSDVQYPNSPQGKSQNPSMREQLSDMLKSTMNR